MRIEAQQQRRARAGRTGEAVRAGRARPSSSAPAAPQSAIASDSQNGRARNFKGQKPTFMPGFIMNLVQCVPTNIKEN